MSPISVLVLGAGELGLAIIKAISRKTKNHNSLRSVDLSVMLRPLSTTSISDQEKKKQAEELTSLGCTIIRYDIATTTIAQLAQIFAGYEAVISCSGFAAGPGTQLKLAHAAIEAKVLRYFPWQFGIDYDAIGRGSGQDLFDEQLDVRDLLRGQDAAGWVIVSTGIFLSFLFEEAFGIVRGLKDTPGDRESVTVTALASWQNGLTVTSVEDIGTLTACILLDESVRDCVTYTAGDSITYDKLADIVGRVSGRPVERQLSSHELLLDELKKQPDDLLCKYRAAFAAGKGVMWEQSKTYNAQKGIQTTNVEQWMRSNLAT